MHSSSVCGGVSRGVRPSVSFVWHAVPDFVCWKGSAEGMAVRMVVVGVKGFPCVEARWGEGGMGYSEEWVGLIGREMSYVTNHGRWLWRVGTYRESKARVVVGPALAEG